MNVKKWNYSNYSSNNYGAHSIAISVGNMDIYFSYETVIAFNNGKGLRISENIWGTTTGKHLNAINPNHKVRIKRDDFEKELETALKAHNLTV